ncbi:PDZ domain-containing protein [Paenibacillus sp.]|uniref:YlbL family protein n=1 Tax=Paenibacillus sp. TaxID=58172 RepID=UPI0028115334|nr:PDZ domain-containing protein [Paenibacillus sp.]
MRRRRWHSWLSVAWPGFAGLMGTIAIWFLIPVPYIVYEPGPAAETRPMVETKAAADRDAVPSEGAFLMTTVRWTYANVFKYVAATYDPDAEIYEKETITRGASRTDYVHRQRLQMRSSHSDALEAVYRSLGIPYEARTQDIVVFSVLDGFAADGVLRPGDRLLAIDGKPVERDEDVRAAMEGKAVGEEAEVTFRRGGAKQTARLTLRALPNSEPPRPGMGITYGALLTIESEDPAYRVDIRAGSIGGPSAGLMFALEMYDRFTEGDLTRGYRVAGTGEIAPDGSVGTIGGVVHKVVGAHRSGAEVFFVPPGNAEAALAKAASIGTDMDVVTVASLKEALDYLASLPEKSTRIGGL